MKLKAENGVFVNRGVGGDFTFKPKGKPQNFGRNPADFTVYGVPQNTARMFVGFNVKQTPSWSVDYLAKVFRHYRAQQRNDANKKIPIDASFVIQKGFYTSETDGVVYENSSQLIVLSIFGESEHKFAENMIELAGHIAHELKQESVILEIQRKGVPIEVFGVSWKD